MNVREKGREKVGKAVTLNCRSSELKGGKREESSERMNRKELKTEERQRREALGRETESLGAIIHQGVNSEACYLDTLPPVFLPPPLVLVPRRSRKRREE